MREGNREATKAPTTGREIGDHEGTFWGIVYIDWGRGQGLAGTGVGPPEMETGTYSVGSVMTQLAKAPATKPKDPSLIAGTHFVGEENQLQPARNARAHTQTYKHNINA